MDPSNDTKWEGLNSQEKFDRKWPVIQPIIQSILNYLDEGINSKNASKIVPYREQMEGYGVVYKLSLESEEDIKRMLYQKHKDVIASYARTQMLPRIQEKEGTRLLVAFVEQWAVFKVLNRWMQFFFRYLDNFFVKHQNLASTKDQGLHVFREVVFNTVEAKVTRAVLDVIDSDRNGEILDASFDLACFRQIAEVYRAMEPIECKVYVEKFEVPFIENAQVFYSRQAQQWLASDSTPEYLLKTEQAIEAECTRVKTYFQETTEPKVRKKCAETLLKEQQKRLLDNANSGFVEMLKQNKTDDLARVYRLFSQVDDAFPPIAVMLREHIIKDGRVILDQREADVAAAEAKDSKESTNDPAFINALLDLHARYQTMVEKQFNNDSVFQKELKYAFEDTVNTDIGKKSNAELLSAHADSVLKPGGGDEKLSESQIEDVLEKVVQLFSFLSDKDVFSEVYRNHLAKRLLNQRSASPFAEKSMIQKLKLKCGAHFTSKMEGMLNDFELVKDVQRKFQEAVTENPSMKLPIEFSCDVLTTGHWPTYKIVTPVLPPALTKCMETFETFYATQTNHRRLTWVHSLGNAIVKGSFKVSYDFQVTTLQAVAMLVFNRVADGKESLTFKQVNELLGNLEVDVAKKILHSLSCQKNVRVLVKEPDTKKIEETDSFKVAVDFQSKIRKVRIPMPSLEDSHNPQRVEEDRGLAIEAAIVRIMKARKRLQHNLLVTEVVNQLRTFKPAPKLIKKKVEHLIEREYLKRDENEANFYQYLA